MTGRNDAWLDRPQQIFFVVFSATTNIYILQWQDGFYSGNTDVVQPQTLEEINKIWLPPFYFNYPNGQNLNYILFFCHPRPGNQKKFCKKIIASKKKSQISFENLLILSYFARNHQGLTTGGNLHIFVPCMKGG